MSDDYWAKVFREAEREMDEILNKPNQLDALAARLRQLGAYRNKVAAGVWHETDEHLPPVGEWLLTWWGWDDGLRIACLLDTKDGDRRWVDQDRKPLRHCHAMPVRWARIRGPRR